MRKTSIFSPTRSIPISVLRSERRLVRMNTVSASLAITSLGLLMRACMQALVFVIVARALGPSDYGLFVALVSIASLLVPCMTLGQDLVIVKSIAVSVASPWSVLRRAIRVTMLVALPVTAIAIVICTATLPGDVSVMLVLPVLAADGLLAAGHELAWRTFQAAERMRLVLLVRLLPVAARLAAALMITQLTEQVDLQSWVWTSLAASVASLIGTAILLVRVFGSPRDVGSGKVEWRDGIPFSAHALADRATTDADKVLMSTLDGTRGAGVYGAAYRATELSLVPISALAMTMSARLFRAGADGVGAVMRLTRSLLWSVMAYGLVAGCGLMLLAPSLPMLLGDAYVDTVVVVQAMAAFPLCFGLRTMFGIAAAAAGLQGMRAKIQMAAAAMAVVLCVVLIPEYGWLGAVVASIAVEILSAFALYIVLRNAISRYSGSVSN